MIYIASPFFTEKQLDFVREIENCLDDNGIEYFSPRFQGVLQNMTPEMKSKSLHDMYLSNVTNVKSSDILVAVIDDRDIGTTFEIGYAAALQIPVITLTNHDYQVNVMIKECCTAHLKSLVTLPDLISFISDGKLVPDEFKNDNTDVV